MTTATGSTTRNRRFGRAAVKLIAIALLVLAMHGATAGTAGATNNGPSSLRGNFIGACRSNGGTVMEGAGPISTTVTCTKATGTRVIEISCEIIPPNIWYCGLGSIPQTN